MREERLEHLVSVSRQEGEILLTSFPSVRRVRCCPVVQTKVRLRESETLCTDRSEYVEILMLLKASSSWRRKLKRGILSRPGLTSHKESARRNLLRLHKMPEPIWRLPLCPHAVPLQPPASPWPLQGLSRARPRHVSSLWQQKMASLKIESRLLPWKWLNQLFRRGREVPELPQERMELRSRECGTEQHCLGDVQFLPLKSSHYCS